MKQHHQALSIQEVDWSFTASSAGVSNFVEQQKQQDQTTHLARVPELLCCLTAPRISMSTRRICATQHAFV
jgi:hypothetical protein